MKGGNQIPVEGSGGFNPVHNAVEDCATKVFEGGYARVQVHTDEGGGAVEVPGNMGDAFRSYHDENQAGHHPKSGTVVPGLDSGDAVSGHPRVNQCHEGYDGG